VRGHNAVARTLSLARIDCRSDLSDADIEGADFSNALLDKTMQTVRQSPSYGVSSYKYIGLDDAICSFTEALPVCVWDERDNRRGDAGESRLRQQAEVP